MHKSFVALFLCSFVLVSCTKERPGLPPEEVLRRSARAGQELQSATFDLSGSFSYATATGLSAEGTMRVAGRLQDGGQQAQFTVNITAQAEQDGEEFDLESRVEVIDAGEDEVYLQLHELATDPPGSYFSPQLIEDVIGQWWYLPSAQPKGIPASITPDPRLLRAQAEVVSVTKDRGLVTKDERDFYHYDVRVDGEKLIAYLTEVAQEQEQGIDAVKLTEGFRNIEATGELWIDAETFYVHEIAWNISPLMLENGTMFSASFTAQLRDHDRAEPIAPPSDAQTFAPLAPSAQEASPLPAETDIELLKELLNNR